MTDRLTEILAEALGNELDWLEPKNLRYGAEEVVAALRANPDATLAEFDSETLIAELVRRDAMEERKPDWTGSDIHGSAPKDDWWGMRVPAGERRVFVARQQETPPSDEDGLCWDCGGRVWRRDGDMLVCVACTSAVAYPYDEPVEETPTPPSEPLMTPEVRERLEAAAERGLAANRLSAEAQKRVQAKADDAQRALGGNQGFAGETVPPRRMQANDMSPWPLHWIEHDQTDRCRATRLHRSCTPVVPDTSTEAER